jgi:long-chain acyl-CoA synthetase
VNIASLLVAAARAFPERPAISVGNETVATYEQFVQRVARLAGGLRKRCGGKPGARIAIVASNCPQYIETMWACWYAGLCVVPVNARLHPKEVAFIQENCGVSLTFTDDWEGFEALFGEPIPM